VRLSGASNFRDVGGCQAGAGRSVVRARLYRAGRLDALTPNDVRILLGLGVRTVVDLRRPQELRKAPGALRGQRGVVHHEVDLGGSGRPTEREEVERATVLRALAHSRWPGTQRALSPASRARLLAWTLERETASRAACYFELLTARDAEVGRALALLSRPHALPAVVHCTAGKDRTGLVIALVLSLLGVEDADVVADFARSNEHVEAPADDLRPFVGVAPDAIGSVLVRLRATFGSVEGYARERAGLSQRQLAALREGLLVAAPTRSRAR
jgi:protein-tyrosine phosphatase